ncbi:MAG: hypothetical protein AB4040_02825 [Synechococcus sp.]
MSQEPNPNQLFWVAVVEAVGESGGLAEIAHAVDPQTEIASVECDRMGYSSAVEYSIWVAVGY